MSFDILEIGKSKKYKYYKSIKDFDEYCVHMKKIVSHELNCPLKDVRLNVENCRYWYNQGMSPYFAFRESMVEDDCSP